jgi:predicted chitinase
VQLTGRANDAAITQQCTTLYAGMAVDFVANPDSMGGLPGAVRSAIGFWILNRLDALADKGGNPDDVDRITKVANEKTDSYRDPRANFIVALHAFQSVGASPLPLR